MNVKRLVTAALLLGAGLVLHALTPPILFGMRPDFLLAMMFTVIMHGANPTETLVVGVLSGILTALTTTFPGGQIGNMIDKPVTALFAFGLCAVLRRAHPLLKVPLVSFAGTVVSGAVFLGTVSLAAGLPGSFSALMLGVVLPAAVVNAVTLSALYPVLLRVLETGTKKAAGRPTEETESVRR